MATVHKNIRWSELKQAIESVEDAVCREYPRRERSACKIGARSVRDYIE